MLLDERGFGGAQGGDVTDIVGRLMRSEGLCFPEAVDRANKMRVVRFADLRAMNIVHNWVTLSRWIRDHDFPRPFKPTQRTTLFDLDEVVKWLHTRRPPDPKRGRPRGSKTKRRK